MTKRMKTALLVIALAIITSIARAADFTQGVDWNAPVNEPDIMLYRVKVGTQPGNYTQSFELRPDAYVSGALLTKALTLTVTPGAYYYAVVVSVNTSGVESDNSQPPLVFEGVDKGQRKAPSSPTGPLRISGAVQVSLQQSTDLLAWQNIYTRTFAQNEAGPMAYWRVMTSTK